MSYKRVRLCVASVSVTVKKLRAAVQRRPDDSDAWYAYGAAAIEAGDVAEGRQAMLQSTVIGAPNYERMLAVGAMLRFAGQHEGAERVLRRAVDCFPEHPEVHAELAGLLSQRGHDREASEVIAEALRNHPNTQSLHLVGATIQERLGALGNVAAHLTAVLSLDADHVDANRRLAVVLGRLGDSAGAVHCWRRVVTATGSMDLEALTQLGIALSRDGQNAEAVHLLSEVAERKPDVSSVHADMGMALLNAGRLQEAAVVWSRALEADPQSAQAYCGIGLAYQKLGRVHEAVEAFKNTELLAPDNAEGPFNLGLALDALGDREGARRALLRAGALDPDDDEIRTALEAVIDHRKQADATSVDARLEASISGDLTGFQLLDVLEFLRIQRKTGALVVSSPAGTGTLRLVGGAVTSVSAPGGKLLGEALVERKIISRANLDAVLARQQGKDLQKAEVLGAVLLREKMTDRIQLSQVIFQQVLTGLERILSWKEGAFAFHPGSDADSPAISFDLQRAVLELTRVIDERGRQTNNSST